MPSILYYDGLLYMTNEVGVVTCADARTGERVWRHRLEGVFFASPVAGRRQGLHGRARPARRSCSAPAAQPVVLARNDLGERFLASPAIAQGRIFLRSDRTLFSVGR